MSQETEIYLLQLASLGTAAEALAEAARLNKKSISELLPMIQALAEKELVEG